MSLRFNYLVFEQILPLTNALMQNKSLVKLDLSANALNTKVASFICEALKVNCTIAELNLSSNLLDNDFAVDLS